MTCIEASEGFRIEPSHRVGMALRESFLAPLWSLEPIGKIVGTRANGSCRRPSDNGVRGNIFCYHGPSGNGCSLADIDSRQNNCTSSDENPVSNRDRSSDGAEIGRKQVMLKSQNYSLKRDTHEGANCQRETTIQDDASIDHAALADDDSFGAAQDDATGFNSDSLAYFHSKEPIDICP